MSESLTVLQLNAQKSPAVQLSLMKDVELSSYGVLVLSEPNTWRIDGKVIVSFITHSYWDPVLPSIHKSTG